MKKVLFTCLMASAYLTANSNVYTNTIAKEIIAQAKIDIKIKNDTSEAVQVYMAVCAYVFVCISVISAANSAKIGFFFRRFKIVLFYLPSSHSLLL